MKTSTYLIRRILFMACCSLLFMQQSIGQQVAKGLTASNGVFIGFYEYRPTDYTTSASSKYPIIIFLHGIGERGNGTTDLKKVKANAIPKLIDRGHKMRFFWNGKWETFLVLSPQLSTTYGSWKEFYVEEMIKYAKSNLNIDTNRIFLTGLSLGGGGVWSYASASLANAQKLAAIAPVCGTCSMSKPANIANADLPVWAFHASNDGTVSVNCTHSSVDKIKNLNPSIAPIKSIYPDGNHGIWTRSYDTTYKWHEPTIYEWFLGQNKSLAPNILPVANAGNDNTITTSTASVNLNGLGSRDSDGKIVKYIWKKISGPDATITNRLAGATTANGMSTVGVYSFELTVIDNRTSWSKDTVHITVEEGGLPPNKDPIARAGEDVTITLPLNTVALNGSASADPDGTIVSSRWWKVSGPATFGISDPSALSASALGLVAGKYEFALEVADNAGASARDTIIITVKAATITPNKPPVANAGADIEITLPTNTISVDGTASSDPDGTIASYSWTKLTGPATFTLDNATSAATDIDNLVEGIYEFALTVKDDKGSTATDIVTVIVNAEPIVKNEAPVADAGSDISITLPANTTAVSGSKSNDPDGSIVAYRWTKLSGPATFMIATPANENTEINNLTEGTYEFELVVTDDRGATASDIIKIIVLPEPIVPNEAPIAKAGIDSEITLPTNTFTLNGSSSKDTDGSIEGYQWTKISGPSTFTIVGPTAAITQIRGLVEGTYSFVLRVTDDEGAVGKDTVSVVVYPAPPPPNQAPVAVAGADVQITLPVSSVNLSGSGSYDPDGSVSSYRWNKVRGPASFSLATPGDEKTLASSLSEGVYEFELEVGDNGGLKAKDTVVITVKAAVVIPNKAPIARAGNDFTITLPLDKVNVDGSASSDPDGTIASFKWSYVSGPAGSMISNQNAGATEIKSLAEGTYQFELTVTDNKGLTASDLIQVTVFPEPNQAPVANAGDDIVITLPVHSVTLDGSKSTDPDGRIASFHWKKIDGPYDFSLSAPNSSITTASSLSEGSYLFELEVVDSKGLTSKDVVRIVVKPVVPIPNKAPVANAGFDKTITLPVTSITLDATASSDPDGKLAGFKWAVISGPSGSVIENTTSATTVFSNLRDGKYLLELEVVDDNGASAKDVVEITVLPAPIVNKPPVANAGQDQEVTLPASLVALNGSGSYDPDGSVVAYSWSRISGPGATTILNSTTKTPTLVGLQVGQYIFRLAVTDNKGLTATDDVMVNVVTRPNILPTAHAGKDTMIAMPATSGILNGTRSFDEDGEIKQYAWKQVSGLTKVVFPENDAAIVRITNLVPGIYEFELIVKDDLEAISRDTVKVTVVDNFRYEESLKLAPNPAKSQVQLTILSDSSGTVTGRIYNSNGIMIRHFTAEKGSSMFQRHIDVSSLSSGFYFIEVQIGNKKRMITKLLKQ